MRLLVFADLHLDAPFALGASRTSARARRQAIRECLTRICDLAAHAAGRRASAAPATCTSRSGSPPTRPPSCATRSPRLHPLPVFLAPGNHDWLGPASLYRQVAWTDNVHLFEQPRLTPVPLADGFTLWGAAHQRPGQHARASSTTFRVDRGGVHVALFHGSEQGDLARAGAAARCRTRRSGPTRSPRPACTTRWSATSTPRATRPTTPTRATRSR